MHQDAFQGFFSLRCQLALVKARAVRNACRADIKKNCADIKPGGDRIEACLKNHFADVSDRAERRFRKRPEKVNRNVIDTPMSAFGPKRTSARLPCCGSEAGFNLFRSINFDRLRRELWGRR
jgi:Cysteine rich repeat